MASQSRAVGLSVSRPGRVSFTRPIVPRPNACRKAEISPERVICSRDRDTYCLTYATHGRAHTAGWDDTPPAKDEDQDDEDETGGAAGGTEDELPLTGSTTTLLGGGAVLLLGLGAGAYLVARRRRVSFSA